MALTHLAPPGSNLPPGQEVNPLADRLADDYRGMVDRTAELVEALARAPAVVEEGNFDRSAAFVDQLRKHSKLLEATRETEKADYLKAGRTVDGFFKQLTEQLDAAAKAMEGRIRTFLQAKERAEREAREAEAKRQQEEATRLAEMARRAEAAIKDEPANQQVAFELALAAEAAAIRQGLAAAEANRAAQASVADLARTRSAIAGTATLTTHLDFEVTDHRRAVQLLADYVPAEALAQAIRAYMRTYKGEDNRDRILKTQPVAGVRFFLKQTARVV